MNIEFPKDNKNNHNNNNKKKADFCDNRKNTTYVMYYFETSEPIQREHLFFLNRSLGSRPYSHRPYGPFSLHPRTVPAGDRIIGFARDKS